MGGAKKGTSPVIPILIVVALIAVGAGAFFLLSGSDESGPEATAESFFNRVSDGDCAGAFELIDTAALEADGIDTAAAQQSCEAARSESGPFSAQGELISTNVIEETDTSATVELEVETDGETETTPLQMTNSDGDWLIDLGSVGGGGSDSGGVPEGPGSGPSEGGGSDDGGGSGGSDDGGGSGGSDDGGGSGGSDDGGGSGGSDGGGGSGGGSGSGDAAPIPFDDPTGTPEDFSYAEGCAAGDMAACDDLWGSTDIGSELEDYGRTCGGRDTSESRPSRQCEEDFG